MSLFHELLQNYYNAKCPLDCQTVIYKDMKYFFAIISFLTEFFMNKLCIYFSSSIVNVPFRVKLWCMFLKDIFATKLSESRKHGSWRNFFANVVIVIFAIISLKWAFFMDKFCIYLLNLQQKILHEQTTYYLWVFLSLSLVFEETPTVKNLRKDEVSKKIESFFILHEDGTKWKCIE